jgi:hypothetical protein
VHNFWDRGCSGLRSIQVSRPAVRTCMCCTHSTHRSAARRRSGATPFRRRRGRPAMGASSARGSHA